MYMNLIKLLFASALLAGSLNTRAEEAGKPAEMTVYRSPTCGCCGKWLDHVNQKSFNIKDVISDDMQAIKEKYGVPEKLASCHTAVVDGYVIEGHVPVADIQKLLQTKPKVLGIAAPGMPMGSPGMEMGSQKQDYQVMSFDKDGNVQVFATHGADE